MTQKRKQYTMQFKFTVALDAAKGVKTIKQLASDYDLHPNQVSNWKKQCKRSVHICGGSIAY